jgi:hypothetical protein
MAQVIGYALVLAGGWWAAAGYAILAADAYEQQRQAKRRARAAFNAAQKDRMEMVDITPDQPRTIALGRVRAVEGVRRRWVSGANDSRLTMVISLAGHEIDGVEAIYFNDDLLTLDGSGYVTSAPYYKARTETAQAVITAGGGGSGSVSVAPNVPTKPTLRASNGTGRESATTTATVSGSTISISGVTAGTTWMIPYQYATGTSTARVRVYTGGPAQNIGAALAAEYPGKITAADSFAGMACLVVDIDYDPDIYVQGRPNVTALFRGARVYDPRLDSTVPGGSGAQRLATPTTWAWSENPALHAYHYAMHANGWAVPAAEIMAPEDVATEAAACDLSTIFTLRKADGSTTTATLTRYRSGITISTGGDPRAAMDEILEAMAGRSGWAGGTWVFRAGRLPTTAANMDDTWLARRLQADGTLEPGPTLVFSNGVPREQKVNRVTGTCVDPDQRYQLLPWPAVEDATLIAAEGATYAQEVDYQAVNHIAHAQHLAKINIRSNQAALRLQASCNLHAWRVELFDVLSLTLARYGITGKTMQALGWRWHPTEGVQLTLGEITAAIYDPAELTGRDPAPNTSLPSPWDVERLQGLAVNTASAPLADGSVIVRAAVTWTAATTQSVLAGGRVEIQYREVGGTQWAIWEEDGASTQAIVPGILAGHAYVWRARFVSAAPLRVRGDWGDQVVIGGGAVPSVSDLVVVPVASVTVTGAEGTGANHGTWTSIGTLAYTATVTGDATLSVNGNVAYSGHSAIWSDRVSCTLYLNAQRVGVDVNAWAGQNFSHIEQRVTTVASADITAAFDFSRSLRVSLVAGTTYTWQFWAQTLEPASVATTITGFEARLQVYKV